MPGLRRHFMSALAAALWLVGPCGCMAAPSERARPASVVRFDPTYRAWSAVLAQCATPEGFRYELLNFDPSELDRQWVEMGTVTRRAFDRFSRRRRLAFLINAHNIAAVTRVINHYPVPSIEATAMLGSALKRRDIFLIDRKWSLMELREEILGSAYHESRALFALNWAMQGCVPLAATAVTEINLEELLDTQIRRFLADPGYNRYEPRRNSLFLSRLLKDHRPLIQRDFTTLWEFVARYSPPEVAASIRARPPKLKFLGFGKRLNGIARPERALPDRPILPEPESAVRETDPARAARD